MIKLNKGDKVAVVSLSRGILGEDFCKHQLELGIKRLYDLGLEPVFMENTLKGLEYLNNHPEKRAEDLINAFEDPEIKGIICAIGGDDTFRLTPYILNDRVEKIVKDNPKFFMGYSDTTINHLMLYKLGLNTFYGLSFLTCIADMGEDILAYSKEAFKNIFTEDEFVFIPSELWYEERNDFSEKELGKNRIVHTDKKGYELLQGNGIFQGGLIGGCIESIYDLLVGERYEEEKQINEKYNLFEAIKDLKGACLFLETSEERPTPERMEVMLKKLKEEGLFDNVSGILVGKPQNEVYYEEYKEIYNKLIDDKISIVYNVNFGHAYPKMLLQYGAIARVDCENQLIRIERL
ncbi:MAG: S66 family peptidase [Filifactoraceae bacterium]